MDMDTIDRKILTILQQNARTPLKVIAEQVFLSSPAVSARIERLESAGYIQAIRRSFPARRWATRSRRLSAWRWTEPEAGSFTRISRAART